MKTAPRGEWIYTLGGWAIEQFADDSRPFTRAELDGVAPGNPVLLQASYYETCLNSRAAQSLGVDSAAGVVSEAGTRPLAARLPVATGAALEASTLRMIGDEIKDIAAALTMVGGRIVHDTGAVQ